MSDILPAGVSRILDEEAPLAPIDAGEPAYRIDAATKIPISKHHGKLWKSRIDAGRKSREPHTTAWDESIRYYNNNQLGHRESVDNKSGNRYFSKRRSSQWSETENIVYANTQAMMPALYTKNPQVEFTTPNEGTKAFVQQLEDLVNTLANRKSAPGLNMKVHAKQAVLSTELCNIGWLEFGYTIPDNSIMSAQQDMLRISDELAQAKDTKTIRELEGQLMVLEETLDVLSPPGPFVMYRVASCVITDPDAMMPDFSDSKWLVIEEIYPTAYLNAKYGVRGDDGAYMSVYNPTHVLLGNVDEGQDAVENFSLIDKEAKATSYGYSSREQLEKAYRTRCYRIWDKTTRRIYLYAENKWDWPIWVENDPYGLPRFFPLYPIVFNTTPVGPYAHSNTTYYLDQQDAVNEIHSEYRIARQDVKENILYDNRLNKASVEKWLKGSGPTAEGVELPDGTKFADLILEKPNAMLRAAPLFDLQRPLASIDRVSGVSDVMRNVQFKTNTTNRAIENYNSGTALRLDAKIDAIEDALGEVLYGIAFLCAQFMQKETVITLLGEARAEGWQNYTPDALVKLFQCQTVGGSTQKPTSAAKKQQALDTTELLTKLAEFAPGVVIETILTLLNEAFDELELPKNAFERMQEEVKLSMQRGNSTQGASGDGAANAETMKGAGASDTAPAGAGQDLAEVAAIVDNLPPEAKIALGKALANGAPIAEALPEIIRTLQATTTIQ